MLALVGLDRHSPCRVPPLHERGGLCVYQGDGPLHIITFIAFLATCAALVSW
jgi:hypothetical protein